MNVSTKKRISFVVLLCFLCLCLVVGVMPATRARADNGIQAEEVDVSTSEDTAYYMDLDMTGLNLEAENMEKGQYINQLTQGGSWTRKDYLLTTILRFSKVTSGDKPMLVTAYATVSCPASWSASKKFTIKSIKPVNIRLGYWTNLVANKADLGHLTVTFYGQGVGVLMRRAGSIKPVTANIVLRTDNKPDGADDPESPDYDPGDNGGFDTSEPDPNAPSAWAKFWSWFCSIWGSNNFFHIIAQIGFVVLGVFILGVLIKIIRFIVEIFK